MSQTEREIDPWWEMDLGSIQQISHVLIWNRSDCCADRLAPFYLFVSEMPFPVDDVGELVSRPEVGQVFVEETPLPTRRVAVNRPARYVRVQLGSADYLSLAEVEVFGVPSQEPANGLAYAYDEGIWEVFPDLASRQPLRTGTVRGVDLSVRERDDYFALRFAGELEVPSDGDYTFTLVSDGASRLYLNDAPVVDGETTAGLQETSGSLPLSQGRHALQLHHTAREGDHVLALEWEGPGFSRQTVPESAFIVEAPAAIRAFLDPDHRNPSNEDGDGDGLDLTARVCSGTKPFRCVTCGNGPSVRTE